jgi:hypothetical protein
MYKPLFRIMVKLKIAALCVLTLLLFFVNSSHSQSLPTKTITRNVIWFTPAKSNTTINGLAMGLMVTPNGLKINGLNFDIDPLALYLGMLAIYGTIESPFNRSKGDSSNYPDWDEFSSRRVFPDSISGETASIKGVSLSLGGLAWNANISGVALNGIIGFSSKMQGLEITGFVNLHYSFKGVMIAGLRNKVTTGTGLQVGLINTCKKGRVVQIGLVNRIGRRTLPFINFSFRRA